VKVSIEQGLAALRSQAEAIVVANQQDYIEAVQIKNAVNSYIKDVKAKLGPGIASAKEHLDFLKNDMAKYITPAEQLVGIVENKRIRWAEEEKRKAEAEQRRINEENLRTAAIKAEEERKERERLAAEQRERERKEIEAAKRAGDIGKREAERMKKEADAKTERERILAAEEARKAAENVPEVQVKAAVPVVAGAKNQTFYYAEVTNASQIIAAYNQALIQSNLERQRFLQQFIVVDEQAVGAFARKTKNNEEATAQVPGVRFWSKG
jgi:hypothetical protein